MLNLATIPNVVRSTNTLIRNLQRVLLNYVHIDQIHYCPLSHYHYQNNNKTKNLHNSCSVTTYNRVIICEEPVAINKSISVALS